LRYPWFNDASVQGLTAGGKEYLDHVLSEEQLSLYRVVTRDAHRFPELGSRYQKEVVNGRTEIFVKYIDHCAQTNKSKVKSPRNAGNVFEALLRAGLFEDVLHGIDEPANYVGRQCNGRSLQKERPPGSRRLLR
jgi:TetR/AcrR family transcriptional repressor of mexJK operon